VRRLGLLDVERGDEEERLELVRPAFALPVMGRFDTERGKVGGYIYGRKDVVAQLDLKSTEVSETEHYRMVYALQR